MQWDEPMVQYKCLSSSVVQYKMWTSIKSKVRADQPLCCVDYCHHSINVHSLISFFFYLFYRFVLILIGLVWFGLSSRRCPIAPLKCIVRLRFALC